MLAVNSARLLNRAIISRPVLYRSAIPRHFSTYTPLAFRTSRQLFNKSNNDNKKSNNNDHEKDSERKPKKDQNKDEEEQLREELKKKFAAKHPGTNPDNLKIYKFV